MATPTLVYCPRCHCASRLPIVLARIIGTLRLRCRCGEVYEPQAARLTLFAVLIGAAFAGMPLNVWKVCQRGVGVTHAWAKHVAHGVAARIEQWTRRRILILALDLLLLAVVIWTIYHPSVQTTSVPMMATAKFFMNGGVDSNWSSDTNWSTTASSGPNNTTHAVAGDTVTINAGSPACTVDVASACTSVNFTNYTNTLTMTANLTTAGNVTLGSGMTMTGTGDFVLTAATLITSNGKTFSGGVQFGGANATQYTFSGAMSITGLMTINAAGATGAFISAGTISVAGGLTCSGASDFNITRSTITLTGGTWSGSSEFRNHLTIAGNVTISGSVQYSKGTFTYTSGSTTTTGSTLTIGGNATTLNLSTMHLNHMTVVSAGQTITLGSALNLDGTLTQGGAGVYSGAFAITCGNWVLGGVTQTLSGSMTVTGTMTLPNSAFTFSGAFNITCGTLTNVSYTATRIVTWVAGTTITINTAFTTVGGAAGARFTWKTSSAGVTAAFVLAPGATQTVGFVDPTDLDASAGQTIYTYSGVITNSLNWTSSLPGGTLNRNEICSISMS